MREISGWLIARNSPKYLLHFRHVATNTDDSHYNLRDLSHSQNLLPVSFGVSLSRQRVGSDAPFPRRGVKQWVTDMEDSWCFHASFLRFVSGLRISAARA